MLDVVNIFVDRHMVEASLAMNIIEILLEAQSVQNAERLFIYLETRMDMLIKVGCIASFVKNNDD